MHYSAKEIHADTSPPPGILTANHFVKGTGYRVRRTHGTRDWLLTYTIGGVGRYANPSANHLVRVGDIALLAPGAYHDYSAPQPSEPWDFYWSHFIPRPGWVNWLQLPEIWTGFYVLSIAESATRARLIQAFERLLTDNNQIEVFQKDLALNALEEVLLLTAQQRAREGDVHIDERIKSVLEKLTLKFSEPLSVPVLAEEVALSPSRLAHLFKTQTGDSIVSTLLKLRLRQAARLLEFSSQPVSDIALSVGFSSAFYFSRQFKTYYGVSPQAYRKRF